MGFLSIRGAGCPRIDLYVVHGGENAFVHPSAARQDDLPAFMDWTSKAKKVVTLHSGTVVQGLW